MGYEAALEGPAFPSSLILYAVCPMPHFHPLPPLPLPRPPPSPLFQELSSQECAILYSDALQEQSQGQWEQQPRRSIYTKGVIEQVTAAQPDFRAPGGESYRQVRWYETAGHDMT